MTGARRDLSAELTKARAGDVVALSQLVSAVESRRRDLGTVLHDIYTTGGHARIIGITGPPGSGKSSLTSALLRVLRRRGERVAVVAVDPSSALTGGAILGDRLRMTEHSADAGVYVRSVSA
ncbi:MAG: transport system ATPase, partial [Actinomycetia bacterium]|nr:transport system ATPase [Actinomycetes bacterium]